MAEKSGRYWVVWANAHARNSNRIDDLAEPFRSQAKAFIEALEDAGAKVTVSATKRDPKRAYLFHWSWLVGLGKKKAAHVPAMVGVPIQWNHGNDAASKKGAMELVHGFALAIPPKSTNAPALRSNHIAGLAIDMHIVWSGKINVKRKDGKTVEISYMKEANLNPKLHLVGASYGVKKLVTDAPHWSYNGR